MEVCVSVRSRLANRAALCISKTPRWTRWCSPVYAGRHYKRLDLSTTPATKSSWTYRRQRSGLGDHPEQLTLHRNMVKEAAKLSLRTITTLTIFYSIERQRWAASDWNIISRAKMAARQLLHGFGRLSSGAIYSRNEYTHSWDGSFGSADLWTPNFDVPCETAAVVLRG